MSRRPNTMACGLAALLALLAGTAAARAGSGHKAHAPPEGRLGLSRVEQIWVYGGFPSQSSGGMAPEIVADPDLPTRAALRCRVDATRGTHHSSWQLAFADDEMPERAPDEVYVGFSVEVDHAGPPAPALRFFEILQREPGLGYDTVLGFLRNEAAVSRWSSADGTTIADMPLVATAGWTRVRVQYRRSTGAGDGRVRIWTGPDGAADLGAPVVDVAHDDAAPVRGIRLRARTSGTLAGAPGPKDVLFRRLAWGRSARAADWGPHNAYELQFGQSVTSADGLHVDVRVHHALDLTLEGTHLDDGALTGRFQVRRLPAGAWTDAGRPVDYGAAVAADPLGDCLVGHTVAGLEPDTSYAFRVRVENGGGVVHVSNTATLTTLSADLGAPTRFAFVYGSCSEEESGTTGSAPHDAFADIARLDPRPRAFVHLGDVCYADIAVGAIPAATTALDFRRHLRMQVYDSMEQARVFASMASTFMRDDHEVENGWWGAGTGEPLALIAESDAAFGPALLGGRTVQPLPGVPGGDHCYWRTARCLFIVTDVRAHKNLDPGARTYWGAAQAEAIRALLRTNTKPIVFWFAQTMLGNTFDAPTEAPEPFAQEMCSNWQEWMDERDAIIDTFVAHNPTTSRLLICSGDRHAVVVHNGGWADHPNVGPEYCVSPLDQATQWPPAMQGGHLYRGAGENAVGDYVHFYAHVDVDETALDVRFTIYDATDPREPRSVIYTNVHHDMAEPSIRLANDPAVDTVEAAGTDDVVLPDVALAPDRALVVFAVTGDPEDAVRTDGPIACAGGVPLDELVEQDDPQGDRTVHAWFGSGFTGPLDVTIDWGTTGGRIDGVRAVALVLDGVDLADPVDAVAGALRSDAVAPALTVTPSVDDAVLLALVATNDDDAVSAFSARPLFDVAGPPAAGPSRVRGQYQQTGPAQPISLGLALDGAADGAEDHLLAAVALRPLPAVPGPYVEPIVTRFDRILVLLGDWGACEAACPGDLSGNGQVDFEDLFILLRGGG